MVSNQPPRAPHNLSLATGFGAPAEMNKDVKRKTIQELPGTPRPQAKVMEQSVSNITGQGKVVHSPQMTRIVQEVTRVLAGDAIFQAGLLLRSVKVRYPDLYNHVLEQLKAAQGKAGAQKIAAALLYVEQEENAFVRAALVRNFRGVEIAGALQESSPIRQRYEQIEAATVKAADFEEHSHPTTLTDTDLMKLVLFIEANVQPTKQKAQWYFKGKAENVARDVQIDWSKKEIYLISDERHSQLRARGSYKKVSSCALLHLEERRKASEPVVRLTLHPPKPTKDPAEHVAQIEREFPFYEVLKGIPGIAKIRSVAPLVTSYDGTVKLQKSVSVIMNRADKGTVADALATGSLSTDKKTEMACALVSTYCQMHARGVIHGDSKLLNVLLDKDGKVFVTDFGLSYFVDATKEIELAFPLRTQNMYPAWWSTPFELLEKGPKAVLTSNPRTIAQHKSVESFAVGSMLYEMMYGRTRWMNDLMALEWPPWKKKVQEAGKPPKPHLTAEMVTAMKQEYNEKVTAPFYQLATVPEVLRTREQHLNWVILKLMSPESVRWSMADADAYMKKYLVT